MEGPRSLKSGEMGSLVELLDLVFRKDSASSIAVDYPQFINEENLDRLRVIADGGKIVSHVGYVLRDVAIFGCTMTVGCIGAVASHPDCRGKGLATRVLHDAFECLRAEGADFVIISGDRGLYLRNGAALVGRYHKIKIEREELKEFDVPSIEIEEMKSEKQVPPAVRLYEREPVRFMRLLKDWHFFLASHKCMDEWAKLHIMHVDGRAAYAVAAAKPVEKCLKIAEFAGDRKLFLGGLFHLVGKYGADSVQLSVMDWDDAALNLLGGLKYQEEEQAMSGTVRIMNFPQLVKKLGPRFKALAGPPVPAISASEEDGDLLLAVGENTYRYDLARAAEMVFSGKDVPDALRGALPIPSVWYGLNYV